MRHWLKVAMGQMLGQAPAVPSVRSMLGQSGPLGDLAPTPSDPVKSLTADIGQAAPVRGPLSGRPQVGVNRLAGRSRLNTTIQMNGPLSTTGDFGNPNAARGVRKQPSGLKLPGGLS